jgi:hypothetical protein
MAKGIESGGFVIRRKSSGKHPAKASQRSARPWPEDTHDERLRDALARELIGACVEGLKLFGLDTKKLGKLAAEAAPTGTAGRKSYASELLEDADRLGHAISKWGEDPAYRDITGRHAILSIRGGSRHSFTRLVREFFPGWDVVDVIRLGCKNNVFERVGADKVALLNNCVLYPGNSPLILASAVRTVRRVFRAADFNRRLTSASAEVWPERAVWVEVSDDDFREFVGFIRPQINSIIDMSNRWLIRRAAHPKNRLKKKRLSGLQVLVYRE